MKQKKIRQYGFTLIELLVVVSIIAMLVGILSVAQRQVKRISQNLRQKAAFHAGEISLELFSNDFGDYPDSSLISDGATSVTGAQRLADALFGRDDQGYHPKTKWHPTLDAAAGPPHPGAVIYDATVTLKDRKIPYFERKRAGFHSIYDLWEGSNGTSSIYDAGNSSESFGDNKTPVSPVFTDIFTSYTTATGQQAGMPILYFKANRTARFRADVNRDPVDPVANGNSGEYSQWAYNFLDNYPILQLPWLREPATSPDGLAVHYQDPDNTGKENAQMFYEQLTKRQDGSFYAPYNPNTFIFISAGHDGIFGTKDDLTNFNY